MNDYSALKDILEIFSNEVSTNSRLAIALICFIGINLIVTILNILSQNRLKNKEKKIYSFNIKEKKRIEISEELFLQLDNLTFYNGKDDNDVFLNKIQILERYVTSNRLYISKSIFSNVEEQCDYFKSVLGDYRKKNYAKELEFTKNFCNIFNS